MMPAAHRSRAMTARIELSALPPALPTLFHAALSARRRPRGIAALPELEAHLSAVRIEPGRLAAYNELLGFHDSVPIAYPQVLAATLHMHLMTQPEFPLPLLGLVHVRNEIEQQRPLEADEALDLRVAISASRETRSGLEFDLVTEYAVPGQEPVWKACTTILHRVGKPAGGSKSAPPTIDARLSQYLPIRAPEDIGRRYAKVSGDYNPIHLYAASAKLFGFPRAIAHGMWSAARCLALLQDRLATQPRALSVQFKQPLLLPGRAVLRAASAVSAGAAIGFALVGDSGRVHLSGTLR